MKEEREQESLKVRREETKRASHHFHTGLIVGNALLDHGNIVTLSTVLGLQVDPVDPVVPGVGVAHQGPRVGGVTENHGGGVVGKHLDTL